MNRDYWRGYIHGTVIAAVASTIGVLTVHLLT